VGSLQAGDACVCKLIIDDGDIITAGGVMAWVDLGLHLIYRWISPAIMMATARFFLVDAAGREQRIYAAFAPRLHHGDETVLQLQHWLQVHYATNPTVTALAARAKLGERTFLRRFRHATGLMPTEYLQHLRVEKAREALELSMQAISDEGAFRSFPANHRPRAGRLSQTLGHCRRSAFSPAPILIHLFQSPGRGAARRLLLLGFSKGAR